MGSADGRGHSFVGRTDERAVVSARVSVAAGGQAQVVLVEGEAGYGKTELVGRVMRESCEGFVVLRAEAEELAIDTPLYLLGQLGVSTTDGPVAAAMGLVEALNRPGVKASEAIIDNWWRQGMMGGAKAHYDGIVAFSQTDFTEDLKKISVPVLVMHGDDDQIVRYADSGPLSAKLVQHGTLKTYAGFPHGMPTTQAPTIDADLLTFIRS
jgi:non-heme chloroperoxidase